MAERDDIQSRAIRVSAELAKASAALADSSEPAVMASLRTARAGTAAELHKELLEHAEVSAKAAPAIAVLSAPIAELVRAPLAEKA